MEKKKRNELITAILYLLAAVIWCINLYYDFRYETSDVVGIILHIVVTVCFGICAVTHICGYLKGRKAEQ